MGFSFLFTLFAVLFTRWMLFGVKKEEKDKKEKTEGKLVKE